MCEKRKPSGRCYVCEYNSRKAKDIYRWSYDTHKKNAKRRGIPWRLSFKNFKAFAIKTELLLGSGRTKESLSIDRKDQTKGYTKNNIQVMTVSDNVKKYIEWKQGEGLKFRRKEETIYENPPF